MVRALHLKSGDSLVLHCASLLRTTFASIARAHERMRVQNVRDFLQTKLDSEVNAPFLLNEHGDPTFYFIILKRTIISITEIEISRNLWLLFWQIT